MDVHQVRLRDIAGSSSSTFTLLEQGFEPVILNPLLLPIIERIKAK
jgi:hypothetical protein